MEKKQDITEEEKQKYKAFFEGEIGIFIIEKLACDVIECSKLPEAIELRKKLGYNHDDIMFEKKHQQQKNKITKILCLIKNLMTENQVFGLQIIILLLKLMKETMKIMTQMMKKKNRRHVIQMILILIFLNF